MLQAILIKDCQIVNERKIFDGSIFIKDGKIHDILQKENSFTTSVNYKTINAKGKILIPGVIDDQVHFREPGLIHKADIYTESKAAISGGITSYMEMPNTIPQTINQEELEKKNQLAAKKSLANYSFYIGATNHNLEELLKTDAKSVCGIKIFMGSSTGNMLVDDINVLSNIFKESPLLIAVHCEDETIIKNNIKYYRSKFGENVPINYHPLIRSELACYKSSSFAVELAKKYNSRLHLLHLSTEKEVELLDNSVPSSEKQITAEVCIHHLYFEKKDYDIYGTKIKWNPAIKSAKDKNGLLNALINNKIDVVATDHAPHTEEEKQNTYFNAPSGGPMVQHSLSAMLELYHEGKITIEKIVEKMCHAPADIFKIDKRGYIRKGYWADLVLVDINNPWEVTRDNILYKCKWSPFEGHVFNSKVSHTFVNGNLVYENGKFFEKNKGQRLVFNR
ncbi:MAG: dihydroorotase [Bacteroidales bacterium]|nr:dihydroorotase [Bacteroidales bacterium]